MLPTKFTIIADLKQKFAVLGDIIDLSLHTQPTGQQKIFDTLQALYRSEYHHDQRLLVWHGDSDHYSFDENVAGDSIIYLQQCLQQLDISNFFVTVISTNTDIAQELDWARHHFSTDDSRIDFAVVQGKFEKIRPQRETFCVVPWIHLHVTTQLDVAPCCLADTSRPWGSLKTHSVQEIINSDMARSMRQKMLANRPCKECKNCYDTEKYRVSRRQQENKTYQAQVVQILADTPADGSIEDFVPVSLDLRLNNTCNLKCRTCDGLSSSRLAQEEKKLFNNDKNFVLIPSSKLRSSVLRKVIASVDTAESIVFNGGEPLIMDEHYAILDRLLDCGNSQIQLFYNTNFSLLQHKQHRVFDYWRQFTNVNVAASIDGHGRVFEYVRHGAKWEDIQNNVNALKQQCPHVKFGISSTLSVLSVESVMELQEKWHLEKILDISNFQISAVNPTHFYSLQTFEEHHKETVSHKIDRHCAWLLSVQALDLEQQWRKMQTMMWAKDRSFTNHMLAPLNRAKDLERKESFVEVFPHLADLFA